jgi:uncharacterized surface protein with fasciclin (FAS1) repeats
MTSPTRMVGATALIAPLGAIALSLQADSAQAADIVDMLKDQPQFSTLAKAIESAGLAQALQGEGPYTVFAPTDQAFDQLPQGAVESLQEDQLKALLQYHVVEGEAIEAEDALGKEIQLDTLAGDSLAVDGTGQMVMLLPAGQAPETQVTEGSDMPASEHQQQVLATAPGTEQQQTMPEDSAMPASPHQEQVLEGQGQLGQTSSQQAESETEVTEGSDMPASEHQRQVLATEPGTEPQETMPKDTAMPASPHQEQLLKGQQPGEGGQQGVVREATVIEPDIQADNGVIHAIDAVLVPQSVLPTLEKTESTQPTRDQQG